jgi:hypothetical protein
MEQLQNSASTTLNGAINSSVTSVTVTDGSVFPASGNFRILVESEIMIVTARTSNTLTVTRGAESTTAASHSSGVSVEHVYTKGSVEQILNDYYQVGGYASRPATPRKGTIYQATDLCHARWFYNGTNWDLIHPSYVPYSDRIDFSGWTALNIGTGTFTDKNGICHINRASASDVAGYYKALPTAPYKLTLYYDPVPYRENTRTQIFLGVRENATGKLRIMAHAASNTNTNQFCYESWTNATTFSANVLTAKLGHFGRGWMRFEDDNTNWKLSYSKDGMNFSPFFTETRNTGFTADKVFVGMRYNASISGGTAPAQNGNLFLLGYKES